MDNNSTQEHLDPESLDPENSENLITEYTEVIFSGDVNLQNNIEGISSFNPQNSLNLMVEDNGIIFSDAILQNYGAELMQNSLIQGLIPNSNSTVIQNQDITYCILGVDESLSNCNLDLNIENAGISAIDTGNEELPHLSSDSAQDTEVANDPKDNELEFKSKLKKESQEAYKRRLKVEATKREKKRERDREYQKKRYQKLKESKNKTQRKENTQEITNSSSHPESNQDSFGLPDTVYLFSEDDNNDILSEEHSYFQSCDSRPNINIPNSCNKRRIQSDDETDLVPSPKVPKMTKRLEESDIDCSTPTVKLVPKTDESPNLYKLETIRIKARERQRKRRSLMTEEQLELKRAKNREYMAKKKQEEKENPKEISEREKRRLAKLNRERVKKWREKKKREKIESQKHIDNLTSEDTISEQSTTPSRKRARKPTSSSSKKLLQHNKALEAELKSIKGKLKTVNQRCEKYKKRFQRMVQSDNSPSPSKKIRKLAGGKKLPTPVKRRLKFFETLESGLIKKRKEIKKRGNLKELNEFNAIISSPKLKKRKILNQASNLITYKGYKKAYQKTERKPSARRLSSITVHLVKKFYLQDNVSKMLPGKRDFKSNNKIKKQKRLLMGTYKELLRKFNKEHPTHKIKSIDTFRRLKPFWVVPSKLEHRNTCACIICSNVKLMLDKTIALKLTNLKLGELVESSVCNSNSKSCMLNKCQRCDAKLKNTLGVNDNQADEDMNDEVTYFQWSKSNKTIANGKTIKVVTKAKQTCSKKDFLEIFFRKMLIYREHVFKIKHQFSELKALKENLKEKEALVHMDFSENYVCKGFTEPQSMHFGGSKNQLSLHTVVIYRKNGVKSICTVSTNTDHRAYAVWAHLRPIFDQLQETEILHLQSDGPSSQYKNRFNMYFITKVKDYLTNLKHLTWNYSISGHGKGASDGVGGTVKRSADLRVKNGNDIFDVDTFIAQVKEATEKIDIIEVKSEEILNEKEKLKSLSLEPIPSCSKVHQVTWSSKQDHLIHLRELSCFSCKYDSRCDHHGLQHETHSFKTAKPNKTLKAKKQNKGEDQVLTTVDPQQDMMPVFNDPKENDWLLVKFKGRRSDQYYVCVVENITEDGLQVHCARNMGNNMTFKWAVPNDKCTIDYDQIQKKLPSPTFKYKNDRMVSFQFPVNVFDSVTVN